MNKWIWFGVGVAVGYLVAPKLRALTGSRIPQVG